MRLQKQKQKQFASALTVAFLVVLTGCGQQKFDPGSETSNTQSSQLSTTEAKTASSSTTTETAPSTVTVPAVTADAKVTKNTTRVASNDPTVTASLIAKSVFPAGSLSQRPSAISLVPIEDWQAVVSSAQLMASPLKVPTLLVGEDGATPLVTSNTVASLQPRGTKQTDGNQLIAINHQISATRLKTTTVNGIDAATTALKIDRLRVELTGKRSQNVVVAPVTSPQYAAPAAAWAAKSGDPVLYASRSSLPTATKEAIKARNKPNIYILGPEELIGPSVFNQLKKLGDVVRISGKNPVHSAINFAKFADGEFGWGVNDPGHGIVFASEDQPLDGVVAAPLAASGMYSPLLLSDRSKQLSQDLESYLLDIQPGYANDPVRGVYNHGWIVSSENLISLDTQSKIDSILEIVEINQEADQ